MEKEDIIKFLNFKLLIVILMGIVLLKIAFVSPPSFTGYWVKGGNVYNCTTCSDCNSAIVNASSGDIVTLVQDITGQSGNCIEFNGKDNITFDCNGYDIVGDGDIAGYGIFLSDTGDGSNNNTVKDCSNISDFGKGIYAYHSDNNNFTNITANNNDYYGFHLEKSEGNTLTNLTLQENTYYDFNMNANLVSYCNNVIENITGSGGRPIEYYNSSVNLQDKVLSELILCNAGSSNITNITIIGSDTIGNNVIYLFLTENANLTNINSSENYYGFWFYASNNNVVTNVTINSNTRGIYLGSSNNNIFTNITANNNTQYGFYQGPNSQGSILTNLTLQENGIYDFWINDPGTEARCNNIIQNVTGSGGRPIEYYNYSVNLQDKVLSELILCNADSSNITNITISGSDTIDNNLISLFWTENANFTDINSSENNYGFYFFNSDNNTLTDITVNNNYNQGVYLFTSSDNNTLTNITVSDNRLYGIVITSAGNNILTDIVANDNINGFYLYSSSNNNIFTNITTNDNTQHGFYSVDSDNNTITDIVANNNNLYGLYFSGSNDSIITNAIANNNNYGLYFSGSNDSIITNATANNNTLYSGFYFINSGNNNITDIVANNNNRHGLRLDSSNNNTFTKIASSDNTNNGLFLNSSSNNTFTNMTANDNSQYGLYFLKDSQYNTINDSYIKNSGTYGIYLVASGSDYPLYNILYNNYLDNSINLNSSSNNNLNYWNTTQDCSKTNILGYSCIGGNYWTDPSGGNFSDSCADVDGNKICDLSYTPFTNNTDYLPLANDITPPTVDSFSCSPSSVVIGGLITCTCTGSDTGSGVASISYETNPSTNSAGTFTTTCNVTDNAGNSASSSFEYTVINVGGESQAAEAPPQSVNSIETISPGETTVITDFDEDFGIQEIQIDVEEEVQDAKITVTKYDDKPAGVAKGRKGAYKYLQIKEQNIGGRLKKAKIIIQVNKTWIESIGAKRNHISVFKFNEDSEEWIKLATNFKEEDDRYFYYEVEVDSFSYFAIVVDLSGTGIVCIPKRVKCVGNELQQCSADGASWETLETCSYGCKDNQCIPVLKGIIYYVIIVAMSFGILIMIYFGYRHISKKRLEEKMEESELAGEGEMTGGEGGSGVTSGGEIVEGREQGFGEERDLGGQQNI